MADQICLVRWACLLKEAVVNFYRQFKAKKIKYSVIGLILILVCGAIYIQGLRHAYIRGFLYSNMSGAMINVSRDLWGLESFDEEDMKRLEKHLERSLDYSISDTRMGRVPFSEPWYMGFQTRQEKESQEKVMIEILTRVAVYRKTHPAISPWLLPGESSYDDLMAYLPHDNTEVAHDNSTLISHEGEQ